ncbi:low molecular weight phosphatase family protein [Allorhizobium terrae]|uniref:Uncharacterized protein n=1 Tax=Allorhizobium terrae TaxID=1848972 RepID=A0A4S3ZNI2_9HYPH|nr:hypothetical protein [Allorhizobium terrae]THF46995.1 hypothetical protein E6C51_19670 [Allorhizobium terrae]
MTSHWGIEDPAAIDGKDPQKRNAYTTVLHDIKLRFGAFAALPLANFERLSLLIRLKEIDVLECFTHKRPNVA